MADLISRAAVWDLVGDMAVTVRPGGKLEGIIKRYANAINGAPAVEAVPVVRCAYCKHCFDMGSDPMEPYDGESEWYCERFDRDTSAYKIDPYRFYCADGERRDDDAAD